MSQWANELALWNESGWPLFQPFFALLVAIVFERLLPPAPQWEPFILFRGMAHNLEQRVNPQHSPNSYKQQLISGSLSIVLMLTLVVPLIGIFMLYADASWPFDAAIMYLCLQWQPVKRDIATISAELEAPAPEAAKQVLATRLRRETQTLSPMGIAKATIEMAALRYFYTYITIIISFLLLGPLAALTMRCLFELGQAWHETPLQQNGFTQPINKVRGVLEWFPKWVWIGLIRLSNNWRASGQFIHQQAGIARGRQPILAAVASMNALNLGGPAIYAAQKIRYPRIKAGKNPQSWDIIPATKHIERVGTTLLISAGLIYLTISFIPLIIAIR